MTFPCPCNRLKGRVKWKAACHLLSGFVALWILFGLYAGVLHLTGNFHAVVKGEFYRSAQPGAQRIAEYKEKYGINTIINLRGEHAKKKWYQDEMMESARLGIDHIDFGMSASADLSRADAEQLISIFRKARKPILVHCFSGADRTGLASALYIAAIAKGGEEESEGQLSLEYGHVPIPYLSSAFAMDDSFENLESWLGYDGS